MRQILIALLILTFSQLLAEENPVLKNYISTALESNLALQQQEFSYQQSLKALKEARGLFLPSIAINARYSRAQGGRTIDIPVDQFLNPVYQTLNAILQQNIFPEDIQAETIQFLREKEHETKIRAVQPVFDGKIFYNYKIKKQLKNLEMSARDAYKRELIAEVKTAYFNYLKTLEIIELLDRTRELLEENLRVNQKLVDVQKATRDAVYRARADLSFLEKEQADAEKNRVMAQAYFNFLLNRPQDQEIEVKAMDSLPEPLDENLSEAEFSALENREELKQLNYGLAAAKQGVNLNRTAFLPNVVAVFDYGFQGEFYRFSKEDDYWMASAVLEWNLFNGFQDKARVEKSQLEKNKLEARQKEVENQIRLEVREAYYSVLVALKNFQSFEDRLTSQKKSFEIVDKKYQQGMALQVEYLDARNTYVRAEIDLIVARYDYFINETNLERVVASYPLSVTQE
jgi:outer membrane protein TolC